MKHDSQTSRYYFRALNSVERICSGDLVLIEIEGGTTPSSIVLTSNFILKKAEDHDGKIYGRVVNLYIRH